MSNYNDKKSPSKGWNKPQDSTQHIDLSKLILKPAEGQALDPELFSAIAKEVAVVIAGPERHRPNAPTQIRKFYDEIVMWDEKVRQDKKKLPEYLPFIRMLNAKASYAQGRSHVDLNFVQLIEKGVSQIECEKTMSNFKYFFEAFVGYYKLIRSK